jgi:hypothetical protein
MDALVEIAKQYWVIVAIVLYICIFGGYEAFKKKSWMQRERANTVTGRLAIVLSWAANTTAILALSFAGFIYFKGHGDNIYLVVGAWSAFGIVIFLIGKAILFVLAGPVRISNEQNQSLEKAH